MKDQPILYDLKPTSQEQETSKFEGGYLAIGAKWSLSQNFRLCILL